MAKNVHVERIVPVGMAGNYVWATNKSLSRAEIARIESQWNDPCSKLTVLTTKKCKHEHVSRGICLYCNEPINEQCL